MLSLTICYTLAGKLSHISLCLYTAQFVFFVFGRETELLLLLFVRRREMTIGLWSLLKGLFNTDQRGSGSSTGDTIERSMADSGLWVFRVAFPSFNIFKLLFWMKLAIRRPLALGSALPYSRLLALKYWWRQLSHELIYSVFVRKWLFRHRY